MTNSFDPYHTWLGIPPQEQPPNHYQLLGVSLFESHSDVISNAADRQMLLLRTFQTGEHAALSQKLLNEVAAARVCLLRPKEKAAYDARLAKDLAAQGKRIDDHQEVAGATSGPAAKQRPTAAGQVSIDPSSAPQAEFPDLRVKSSIKRDARRKSGRPGKSKSWNTVLGVVGAAAALLIVAAVLFVVNSGKKSGSPALRLKSIAPVTVTQGDVVSLQVGLENPDAWREGVTYALGSGAPPGAGIDRQTGQFRWRASKPGKFNVSVLARAGGSDSQHEESFLITVQEKARPPVLAAIPDQSLERDTEFHLSADVTDRGAPGTNLHFSLGPGAPDGMEIDGDTGTISWQPSDNLAAGEYKVTVCVRAATPDQLGDEETFAIRLAQMKAGKPPALAAIGEQSVAPGAQFTLPVRLDDPGTDAEHLRFQLDSGAPAGMAIDPDRGIITWRPSDKQGVGEYPVTVRVESTEREHLKDEQTFRIRVAKVDAGRPGTTTGPRLPVPDQSAQAPVLAELKDTFKSEYAARSRSARLALAARLILRSREASEQPVKRYVMLEEARSLATEQNDTLLSRLAVDGLAASFDLDAIALKAEDFSAATRRIRTPAQANLIVEAAEMLAREALAAETYDTLLLSLRRVEKITSKGPDAQLAQAVREARQRIQAMRELCRATESASPAMKANPDDPGANLCRGRFDCLARLDWETGLPLLAKGGDDRLSQLAARLVAQADDVGAQLSLADAWWELARKERPETGDRLLLEAAARYWYQRALPGLADEDLARVQSRLTGDPPAGKRPFWLPLGGVAGLTGRAPKKVSGKVGAGQFASFQGKGSLEYDQIPASSYIHELDVVFAQPQGSLTFAYGDTYEGARINIVWMPDTQKFRCRLITYRGGWSFWGGERNYDPQQPLHFTLYVTENRQSLYQDGARILATGARPADLHLRISSGVRTLAQITRCAIRPWTEPDARRLKTTMPPTRIETNWPETALHLYERRLDLGERPVLSDGKPFVADTTGTVMQWIPAGSFQRKPAVDKRKPAVNKVPPTQVTITYGFWIGRYEISQGEWAAIVPVPAAGIRVRGSPFLPVDGVSREDAAAFCQLLTQSEKRARRLPTGYQYRLPTEAEWEYACRAGADEDFSVDPDGFWCAQNSQRRPHQIGQGRPNPWDLYDMHGNVDEWCFDAWRDEPTTPVLQLTDPVTLPKSASGYFVLRGGAWWKNRANCAANSREKTRSIAGGHRGFRVVLGPVLR